jgi:hypothetical protein
MAKAKTTPKKPEISSLVVGEKLNVPNFRKALAKGGSVLIPGALWGVANEVAKEYQQEMAAAKVKVVKFTVIAQ